jgi:DNA-binding PadR family transcriptional regulator
MNRQDLNPTAASILGFLHEGPLTGWDLVNKTTTTIADFWNVTKSQVYGELRHLAEQGLVREGKTGRRERRPYTITKSGRAAFSAWIALDPADKTMRFPLALTIYFGRHVEPSRLEAFCRGHRARHDAQLKTLRQFVPVLKKAGAHYELAVLKLGIGFHELVVNWIDEVLETSDRSPRSNDRTARRRY